LALLTVVFLHMGWGLQPIGSLTIIPLAMFRSAREILHTSLMGLPAPALLVCLFHQMPILVFVLLAAARKMRHELMCPFSKTHAIGFQAVIALLLLMDAPGGLDLTSKLAGDAALGLGTLAYGVMLFAMILGVSVAPGAGEFAKGIRHARKLGWPGVPRWDDGATNAATLCVLAAISALAILAALPILPGNGVIAIRVVAVAIAVAGAILFLGLSKQYFALLFRRNSSMYLMLLLFACWACRF